MHRYFFTTKDSFISSGSNTITGEDFTDKNTGQDEVLELKKVFFNRGFHYPTRVLVQFDTDEIETYISSSVLPNTYKLNFGMKVLVKRQMSLKQQKGVVGSIDKTTMVLLKWIGIHLVELI